jgi:hypothetical protein
VKDLTGLLEVFIFTNGRGSFDCSKYSVETQVNVKFKTTIIKDMSLVEASNFAMKKSKSKFYMKVDDDMFLHPRCIEYFANFTKSYKGNCAMAYSRLWEPSTLRVIDSLKAYNTKNVRKIGFSANSDGRIDKIFLDKVKAGGFGYKKDGMSVVAIHCSCPSSENMNYAKLRGEKVWDIRRKRMKKQDRYFRKNGYKSQFKKRKKQLNAINKKRGSSFWKSVINK